MNQVDNLAIVSIFISMFFYIVWICDSNRLQRYEIAFLSFFPACGIGFAIYTVGSFIKWVLK